MALSIFERNDIVSEATIRGFDLLLAICHALARPGEIERAAMLVKELDEARQAADASRLANEQAKADAVAAQAALAEKQRHWDEQRDRETAALRQLDGDVRSNEQRVLALQQSAEARHVAADERDRAHAAEKQRLAALFGAAA
jgi:hypothetical protein